MKYSVHIDADFAPVMRMLNDVSGHAAKKLFKVGTYAVRNHIRKYMRKDSVRRHVTADRLGARPTGHMEKGIRAMTCTADEKGGVITIPIAGLSRAFGDIKISTPTRTGKRYVTIPKHAAAYGRKVGELKRLGWTVFRPGKKKVLLGYRRKGDKPVMLYALATKVRQKKDPSLLPPLDECARVATAAMMETIARTIEKGGRA